MFLPTSDTCSCIIIIDSAFSVHSTFSFPSVFSHRFVNDNIPIEGRDVFKLQLFHGLRLGRCCALRGNYLFLLIVRTCDAGAGVEAR